MFVDREKTMNKLILICIVVFLSVASNAQENIKPKLEELNQDQLEHALKHASKTVNTGKILFAAGAGASTAGFILFVSGINDALGSDADTDVKIYGGSLFLVCGFVSTVIGVPVWISGSNKKKKISLELAKFNTPGLSSITGVGIKVRF